MEINVTFGFNNANSSSAGAEGRDQPGHAQILSKVLILNLKNIYLLGSSRKA